MQSMPAANCIGLLLYAGLGKNMGKDKKILLSLASLITLLLLQASMITLLMLYSNSERVLYPQQNTSITQTIAEGSATDIFITDSRENSVSFDIKTVEEKRLWKRERLIISCIPEDSENIKIESFDFIDITLNATNLHSVTVQIGASKSRTLDEDIAHTIFLGIVIPILEGEHNYKAELSKFKASRRWCIENKVPEHDKTLSFKNSKLVSINLELSSPRPRNGLSALTLQSIKLSRNRQKPFYFAPWLILLNLLVCIALYIVFRKKKKQRYDTTKNSVKEYEDTAKLIYHYIEKNHTNPELTLADVAEALRLRARTISPTLRLYYKLGFSDTLNQIRIAKAVELLLSTELKIIDIAHRVGYSSLPHFNLCFKKVHGSAPSNYRASHE